MKKLLLSILAALSIAPAIAFASQITVPSAPGAGYALVSTSTGNYIATTTDPFHVGALFATSSTETSILNGGLTVNGTLTTSVTGSTQCLHVNSSGVVSGTGTDCGSGGGSVTSLATTYPLKTTGATGAITLSTDLSTTTQNFWSLFNNFTYGSFSTLSSSTNATTTGSFYLSALSAGGLSIDANHKVYSAATTTAGTGLNYSGNAFNVNTTQNITNLSNLSSNGLVKTSSGNGTLSIATNGTDYSLITALTCSAGQFFQQVTAAGVFTCGAPTSGITALGNYSTTTGTAISLSTSTLPFNGLTFGQTIVEAANGMTFTPTVTGTLNNNGLTNSSITVNTSGGTSGGATVSLGGTLNLSSFSYLFPNNATSTLLSFTGGASTTQLSIFQKLYVGGNSTTTIDSSGNVVIPSGASLTNTGTSNGCATWASGVLGSTGVACGSGGSGAAYPFTPSTQTGAVSATTTPIFDTLGLQASSTSYFTAIASRANGGSSLVPGSFISDSSGVPVTLIASDATNFANTSDIAQLSQVNAGDSGAVLKLSNAGSGNFETDVANGVNKFIVTAAGVASTTNLNISALGNAAGSFLATNASGNVIATTSPQQAITLTTTGSSGASTFDGKTLNIPQYSNGAGGKQIYTYIVSSSGGNFTTIQGALNAASSTNGTNGGASIVLTDSSYSQGSTGLLIKSPNTSLYCPNASTTISFTGATTGFKTAAPGYQFSHVSIINCTIQGDGTAGSIAIDSSDFTFSSFSENTITTWGTGIRADDKTNITFYNIYHHNDMTTISQFGINASSTNAWNGNDIDQNFIGCTSNNCIAIQMNNANGNTFNQNRLEPDGTKTGVIGYSIFDNLLSTNNGVFNNTMSGDYIEGGLVAGTIGIKMVASVNGAGGGIRRNLFEEETDENNTTDWSIPVAVQNKQNFICGYNSNFGNCLTSLAPPFGIGTSTEMQAIGNTPYAALGLSADNTQTTVEVAVSNTANRTDFVIDNSGNVFLSRITGSTQCLQVSTTGQISGTGSACGSGGGSFPFTPTTNFGVNTSATSTVISDSAGIFASSTSQFVNAIFSGSGGVGTTSPWGIFSVEASSSSRTLSSIFSVAYNQGSVENPIFNIASSSSPTWAIGTSSGAVAEVNIVGLFGNIPLNQTFFSIASSSQSATTTLFAVNSNGDVIRKSAKPVLGACGTATLSATSTDARGTISVTAGTPTTCNMTFATPKSDTPTCIDDTNSLTLLSDIAAASTTGIQIGLSAAFSGNINYLCQL